MISGEDIVAEWIEECVRLGTTSVSALSRFPAVLAMTTRDYRRLIAITNPDQDRAWSVDDLRHYAHGMRQGEHADALVQVVMHVATCAPWAEAVATLKNVSEAADGLPWENTRS